MTEDALLHQRQPAGGLTPVQLEAHGRAPEAPRRMQQVDVCEAAAWSLEAVKQEARVDEWRVERLAVIGNEHTGGPHSVAAIFQQRPLGGKAGQDKLADAEHGAVEPPASDEKRVRARTACEAGRLQVEEQQPSSRDTDRRLGQQQLQSRPSPFVPGRQSATATRPRRYPG